MKKDAPPSLSQGHRSGLSRRAFLKSSSIAALGGTMVISRPLVGWASNPLHGLSVFGELKYAPGFAHFDYINPDAPKGGRFSFAAPDWVFNQNPQTFNTLNGFVLKGDAPPRIELLFDTLLVRAVDEPDAIYCHLAHSVSLTPEGNQMRFELRPEARFHDGSPVTAADVVFSYRILKEKGHPTLAATLRHLDDVSEDNGSVVFTFAKDHNRQSLLDAAESVPIFQAAAYAAQPFGTSTLTPPIGSGPYKIGRMNAGSTIEYERDPDYWGRDLPTMIGHCNFDIIRITFSRDRTTLFEAFKKGDLNCYEEFSSQSWATQYNFPAVEDGRVTKLEVPDGRPSGGQGWFFNLRRRKFADRRTREAIGLTFDFEWSNKNLFYGLYQRTESFFERTNMKASGLPEGRELDLLEAYRDQLDPQVFGEPVSPPVSDGSGKDRKLLAKANQLLIEAGWTRNDAGLWVNEAGDELAIELLANSSVFERIVTPWAGNLRLLGIPLTFRLVDPAQYQARLDEFDFDMVGQRFGLTANITPSSRSMWGSDFANVSGSHNLAGLKHPVIDALLDAALSATTREDMEAAGRAIDRIWRVGHYWVPNWNKPTHTLGVWEGFGRKEIEGLYDFQPEIWWWTAP